MNCHREEIPVRYAGLICGLVSALVLAACVSAPAAEIHFDLVYVQSTDDFVEFSPPLLSGTCYIVPPTMFHNFQVYMTVSDTAPDEDFWTALYNIDLGPGWTPADFGGFSQWTPNNPTYDPNGDPPPPATPIFSDNGDTGASDHDLQRMFVQVATSTLAQSQPGEPGQNLRTSTGFGDEPGPPLLLGDFWVHLDPLSIGPYSSISISPEGALPWGLYVDGVETAQSADSFSANTFILCIPEPASGVLASLALLVLLGLTRRRKSIMPS